MKLGYHHRRLLQHLLYHPDFAHGLHTQQVKQKAEWLNPFVAVRPRVLWPAATFPDLKPKFQEILAAAAVIHRLTLRVLGLSVAAYE